MSRTSEQLNKNTIQNFIEFIFKNDYDEVESYMSYFKVYNQPEGLNFTIEYNDMDISPLILSAEYAENLNIIKLLLENGADINYKNENGTALHGAIYNDNKSNSGEAMSFIIIKYLLENGADPFIVDNMNQTPIDLSLDIRGYISKSTYTYDPEEKLLHQYMTKYKNIKRLQKKFREKRTKKRNRAAKRIQTRTRDHLSRRHLTKKKAWKGTEAFDPIMYDDKDIFEYLQSDPKNFVIQLPGSDRYEALNLHDLLMMKRDDDLYQHFQINIYDTFYECHKYDINDYQYGSNNVTTKQEFIKLGLASIPTLLPKWFYKSSAPEPRIFKFEKYQVVNSFVSKKIYHYLDKLDEIALHNYHIKVEKAQSEGLPQEEIDVMEPDWPLVSADHCNEKKPIQTYRLVPIDENVLMGDYVDYLNQPFVDEDYMADYVNMLNEYSAPSIPSNNSNSSELRRRMETLNVPLNRRLFDSDSSSSSSNSLTDRFNRLLQRDERPVERRLTFDSDSDDYDPSE